MPSDYPHGAPCRVDTWQPDPEAARAFYAGLFGWTFDGSAARLDGRLVAGVRQAPPGSPALWSMAVGVDDVDAAAQAVTRAGGTVLAREPMTVVADPGGVAFCLWQGEGVEVAGEPNSWAMSALHTTDVAGASRFYEAAFGWRLEPGAGFDSFRLGERVIAVVTATDGVAVPPHWAVNFAVRDVDDVASRAAQLGGAILLAPFDTPGFRNAVVADPQGAVLALSAPR